MFQQSLDRISFGRGSFDRVVKPDPGDPEDALDLFDVSLDLSREVFCGRHLPHVHAEPEGTGQSPGDAGNNVVERGGVFRASERPGHTSFRRSA